MRRIVTFTILVSLFLVAGASAQRTPPRLMSLVDVLPGTEEQEIRWPVAVAAAAPDLLAVADVYRPRLLVWRKVGVTWSLDRTLELPAAPAGLTWQEGRWIVSLRGEGALLVVDENGQAAGTIPLPAGAAPGPLAPASGGGLLVWDGAASAVLRIDRSGKLARSTAIDEVVTGLADDGSGGLVVSLGDRARLLRFDATGQEAAAWDLPGDGPVPAWPAGVTVAPGGQVFVADRHNGRILVLDATGRWVGLGGRQGEDPGLLKLPAGLVRLPDGDLLVADQGNGRAQIFRPTSVSDGS